jgi:hypothetical protein
MQLLDAALESRKADKLAAAQELPIVEQKIKELDLRIRAKQHALGSHPIRNEYRTASLEGVAPRFRRIQVRQQNWEKVFLSSDEARGAIRSGRALNHFLKILGPIAEEHRFLATQYEGEIAKLEEIIRELEAYPARASELEDYRERLKIAVLRQEIVQSFSGTYPITDVHRQEMHIKNGAGVGAFEFTSGERILPIAWDAIEYLPEFLPEQKLRELKNNIEECKASAVAQLSEKGCVEPETMCRLCDYAKILRDLLTNYRPRLNGDLATHLRRDYARQYIRLFVAPSIERFYRDAPRLSYAKSMNELQLPHEWQSCKNINDLLATMNANGLQFAESKVHNPTYEFLFREMIGMYIKLHALEAELQGDYVDRDDLQGQYDELWAIKYEDLLQSVADSLASMDETERDIEALKVTGKLADLLDED